MAACSFGALAAGPDTSDSVESLQGTRWRGSHKSDRDSATVTGRVTFHMDDQLVLVTHGENGITLEWTFKVKGSKIALASFRQTGGTPRRTYREEQAEGSFSGDQIGFSYSFLWSGPQRKNVRGSGEFLLKRES